MQKSVAFLSINNELGEKEIRKAIPFTIVSKKKKRKKERKKETLGLNLTKDVKDLYSKNYKALKKEIIKDTRRWKGLPCS
jgi:hypothetical protein